MLRRLCQEEQEDAGGGAAWWGTGLGIPSGKLEIGVYARPGCGAGSTAR